MAKTSVEEPKYDCNEKIDGTKVYYYFNPPRPEQEDEKKKVCVHLIWMKMRLRKLNH